MKSPEGGRCLNAPIPEAAHRAAATIARHFSDLAPKERQSLFQGGTPWDSLHLCLGALVVNFFFVSLCLCGEILFFVSLW